MLEQIASDEEFDKYLYKMEDVQFHDNGTFSMVAEQYIEELKMIGGGNYVASEDRFYDYLAALPVRSYEHQTATQIN